MKGQIVENKMKKTYVIIFIGILMNLLPVFGQNPKVAAVHDLFNDDLGKRENMFYEVLGAGKGDFGGPAWSPDGKKVIFEFEHHNPAPGEENSLLCVFNIEESSIKVISRLNDRNASWSPDSQQIVFDSDRTGRPEIYKMNIDGTNLIQLTQTGALGPAWSPDGSKICYRNYSTDTGLWIMNSDGNGAKQITYDRWDCQPCWSPDGLRIAYVSKKEGKVNIWVMNADGSNPVQLTTKGGAQPVWSPDGKWIAFERDDQIWLVSSDGRTEVHLRTDFPVFEPSWSPDGSKIVVSGIREIKYDNDLYVISLKY